MFNSDVLPEVSGRALGSLDKRWDLFARNVNFSGTLTGQGLQSWLISNPVPNTDSIRVDSDTGLGLFTRLRIANAQNAAKVDMEIKNVNLRVGEAVAAGGLPIESLSGAADIINAFQVYRRGQPAGGIRALDITNYGELVSYASGYAGAILSAFVWGEANPLFRIGPTGTMFWGIGGATPVDAGLTRLGPSLLALTDGGVGFGSISLLTATFNQPVGAPPFTVVSTDKVVNLNADKLDGTDWGSPPAIGNVARAAAYFTNAYVNGQLNLEVAAPTIPLVTNNTTPVPNLTVKRIQDAIAMGTMNNNGDAFKHMRVAFSGLAAGARVIVRCTWLTAFPTANYTVSHSIFDSLTPLTAGCIVERMTAKQVDFCEFQILNQGAEVRAGTLHVSAWREA